MVEVSQLLEIWMFHQLGCCPALVFIVDQHLSYDVLAIWGNMRYQMIETLELLCRKINLHMGSMLSEIIKNFFTRCAKNFMNLINLVKLIISREQRA